MPLPLSFSNSGSTPGIMPKTQPSGLGTILPPQSGSLATLTNKPLPKVGGLISPAVSNQVALGGFNTNPRTNQGNSNSTTGTSAGLLSQTKDTLAQKQKELSDAQSNGYGTNDTIYYDSKGNVTKNPVASTTPPSTNTQADVIGGNGSPTTSPSTTSTDPFITNVQNLTNYGSGQESPEVVAARKDLADLQAQYATLGINTQSTAGSLTQQEGEMGLLQQKYGQLLTAAQDRLTNALSSQGQQIGAAGTAGGLTQRVGQYGMLTNDITGVPLYPTVMNNALTTAYKMYQAGNSWADIENLTHISTFGVLAGPQLVAMLSQGGDPNAPTTNSPNGASTSTSPSTNTTTAPNITTHDTNVATNQGLINQFATTGANLSNGIQNLQGVAPIAINFLQKSGINPSDAKLYNDPINTAIGTLNNPEAAKQWALYAGELQTVASQIITAKTQAGMTPTATDKLVASEDPSYLSANELNNWINTTVALGNIQVNTAQGQAGAASNAGGQVYAGSKAPTNPTTLPISSPANLKTTPGASNPLNPFTNFAQGLAENAIGGIYNSVSNYGGEVLGWLAHAVIK